MPKTIALEDDGIFVLASYFGSVAHPPGYPLYTAIAHFFAQIPIGSVASRVHFVSALFGALSCGALFYLFRAYRLPISTAALLTLVFATSKTFWSQSIIAEVYTLNILLLILSFLVIHKINSLERSEKINSEFRKWLLYFYLIVGLGVSNHWPLFILVIPSFVILLWDVRRQILSEWYLMFVSILIASIFYLYLIYTTQFNVQISVFGPFKSALDFFEFVSRAHYFGTDNEISASIFDKFAYIQLFLKETAFNVQLLLITLILFANQFTKRIQPKVLWSLVWFFLSSGIIVITLLGKEFNELNGHVYKVYFIPSYLALFMLVALCFAESKRPHIKYVNRNLLIGLLSVALLLNLQIGEDNFRGKYKFGDQYGNELLSRVPQNSILFTDGDIQLGIIGYLVLIEGVRPDITLMSSDSYFFNNRLYHKSASPMEKYQKLSEFIDKSQRPVIFADNLARLIPLNYSLLYAEPVPVGLELSKGSTNHLLGNRDIAFIKKMINHKDRNDPWTDIFIRRLLARSVKHLSITQIRETNEELIQRATDLLKIIPVTFESEQIRLHVLHELAGKDYIELIRKDLLKLVSEFDINHAKSSKATVLNLLAENFLMSRDTEQAQKLILASCEIWPTPHNKACQLANFDAEN